MLAFCSISNNFQHLFAFRRHCQILVPIFRDQNVVLNPDSAHMHVSLQFLLVNVFRDQRVWQIQLGECITIEIYAMYQ